MTGEKMRVYEIAKEVGIPNKDLIAKIRALGLEVNNHMSSLDADDVARIKRSLEKEKTGGRRPQQTQQLVHRWRRASPPLERRQGRRRRQATRLAPARRAPDAAPAARRCAAAR